MAKKESTKKYVEFQKADLSVACQKLEKKMEESGKVYAADTAAYVKQVEADHGEKIKSMSPNGYVYIDLSTKWNKLSGVYDLPGKSKSSSKAVSLK